MYNLLVSGNPDAFEGEPWDIELGRAVREYTAETIQKRFASLDEDSTTQVLRFPALFAYENGNQKPAKLGWLTRVRHRNKIVRVEYEIDPALPPIPPELLIKHAFDFDLADWEMNRTHWAIKDVDLFPVLMEVGIVDPKFLHAQPEESKIAQLGLEKPTAEFEVKPSVFRLPEGPRDRNLVAVMMPFAKEFDAVYVALTAGCKDAGYTCERADNVWEESEVIQDIFSLIYRSQCVICDFTRANPNVFYETGIAHTLGRHVIPIAQSAEHVPFDLRHHRYIKYLDDQEGRMALTRAVTKRLTTLRRR